MRNLQDEMSRVDKRVKCPEQLLGKGLLQPYNNLNSSPRKIMFGAHSEQRMPLMHPERALISCGGYEDQYGQNSSSFKVADDDYLIIRKIPKFRNINNPMSHYITLAKQPRTNKLYAFERTEFKAISEIYGYEYDNSYLDDLDEGDMIYKNSVIRKSTSFDDYNSRMDGVNLISCFLSTGETCEDGILLSKSGARKLASPIVETITITLNENDTPLNLYGDSETYKCMPNVGEDIKNNILMAVRRDTKENALFTHTYNRLSESNMSDLKYVASGYVVDVNIYCNNIPYISNNPYYKQLYDLYLDNKYFSKQLVDIVDELVMREGVTLDYSVQKLYYNCKAVVDEVQYIKDKKFSNIVMEVTVVEESIPDVGDKLSNRYGGKGVIADIWDDERMPLIESTGERVECIFNMLGVCNRLNVGQLFEHSVTFMGSKILESLKSDVYSIDAMVDAYVKFIKCNNPDLGDYVEKTLDKLIKTADYDALKCFLYSLYDDNGIMLSLKPISNSSSIDQLSAMYDEFPYVEQSIVMAPVRDSNGNLRTVKTRRNLVTGRIYIYRLKQIAEEKFMATSLSATNIKGENTRAKVTKNHTGAYNKTPIKQGEMEAGEMMHLGVNNLIETMMVYSVSPKGRKLVEELLTGDPFNVDVELDNSSTNRNVEILNAYLKAKGLKLEFRKIHKTKTIPMTYDAIRELYPIQNRKKYPMIFVNPKEKINIEEHLNSDAYNKNYPMLYHPMKFLYKSEIDKDKEYMLDEKVKWGEEDENS